MTTPAQSLSEIPEGLLVFLVNFFHRFPNGLSALSGLNRRTDLKRLAVLGGDFKRSTLTLISDVELDLQSW